MRAATRQESSSASSAGVYESFSDMVLCTVIVLITLVVVLALNVVQKLNVYIEPNHFSGGATRPWLYLQAQQTDYSKTTSERLATERAVYADNPFLTVNLFSPSTAYSATDVRNGNTVSARDGQAFDGQCDLTAYTFLQLAAGIQPGSFNVNNSPTALMLPKFSHKGILVEPDQANGYIAEPDNELALKVMAMAWPVYDKNLYPRRAASDYLEARTRIFIEVLEAADDRHLIMIGHSVFSLPEDVENGRLGWLAGFSSGLTEVVYLGTVWNDADRRTNKRIAFFEENGFKRAATDYRVFSFPEGMTAGQQQLVDRTRAVNPDLSVGMLEQYVRNAEHQIAISRAILSGDSASSHLPPLLRHPNAWNAYTEHCIAQEAAATPPEWLMTEFLEPLGFEQAVVRGLQSDI
jgi:hypothetical protein